MAFSETLFLDTLRFMRGGKTQQELSEELNSLVQACRDTGNSGKITLTITVKPDRGDTGQYFLTDKIDCKKPAFERGQTICWGTPEGNLIRNNPSQGELILKSAPEPAGEAKTVTEGITTPKRMV